MMKFFGEVIRKKWFNSQCPECGEYLDDELYCDKCEEWFDKDEVDD